MDDDIKLIDLSDILLLCSIGLLTFAWFNRKWITSLLFKNDHKSTDNSTKANTVQRETNFVKVMKEQVNRTTYKNQYLLTHLY